MNLFGRTVSSLADDIKADDSSLTARQGHRHRQAQALRAPARCALSASATKMVYVGDNGVARIVHVVSFFADSVNGGRRPVLLILDARPAPCSKAVEGLAHAAIGTGPAATPRPASTSGARAASTATST